MKIGQNITAARERLNMSQEELAQHVGLSPSSICNYEAGRFEPNLRSTIALAKSLGITLDELVGLEPPDEEGKIRHLRQKNMELRACLVKARHALDSASEALREIMK